MADCNPDPKMFFIDLLFEQKKKLKNLLRYWRDVEQRTPSDEHWRLEKESPFDEWMYPLAKRNKKLMPSEIIEVALETVGSYVGAIESYSPIQLEAFAMGLGLKWIPFQYWGMKLLREWHQNNREMIDYLKGAEGSLPKELRWRHMDEDPIKAIPQIENKKLSHSKIASNQFALLENIMNIFSK